MGQHPLQAVVRLDRVSGIEGEADGSGLARQFKAGTAGLGPDPVRVRQGVDECRQGVADEVLIRHQLAAHGPDWGYGQGLTDDALNPVRHGRGAALLIRPDAGDH
jgi:hypothetical protein